MAETHLSGILETIEQAVETLTDYYAKWLPLIKAMSQEDLKASSHINAGMFIRDS